MCLLPNLTARSRHAALLALACCFFFILLPDAHAAKRIALLVGNATYSDAPLTNPPNDVKAVAQALKDVGFEVRTLTNAGDKQMSRAIRDFGQAAQGAEVALFYYSGHGMQSRGENYLIPVGAQIEHENDLPVEAVSANQVLRWIEEAAPKAAVVILDACRDNPVAVKSKSASKGLSRMDAPSGTLVAYATAPGTTASDEGYYAQSLAKHIKVPGLTLEDVFDRVGADVAKRTRNKQLPRVEDGLYEKVYFVPFTAPHPVSTPTLTRPTSVIAPSYSTADPAEAAYWAEVKKSEDPADYASYLANYPNGRYLADANEYIERDRQAKAAREKLKEDQAWRQAQAGDSQDSYVAYLKAYPSGRYAPLAKLKHDKLKPAVLEPEMVRIPGKNYEIGKYEVTQAQWRSVMESNPSQFQGCDDCPVEKVSWNDTQDYLNKLNQMTGKQYRLPTEGEWKFACDGGRERGHCDNLDAIAKQDKKIPINKIHPVGKKQANGYGLYDMTGNVWEWVQDCYDGDCSERVLRGGHSDNLPGFFRTTIRYGWPPAVRYEYFGFRLLRDARAY
jgi:hypothetical protein